MGVKVLELIPELGQVATVTRFSELTGKTKSVISDHKNSGVLVEGETFLQWLHSYMGHLSLVAAGRGSDSDELTVAKINSLNVKTALDRLVYHEKLNSLVPVDVAAESLIEWAGFTQRETAGAFDQFVHEIEHKYNIVIDQKIREKIGGAAIVRIREYAEKLAKNGLGSRG